MTTSTASPIRAIEQVIGVDPTTLDEAALLVHIAALSDVIDLVDRARQARVDTFRAGRERSPTVKQRPMAEASRMTEGGVINALKLDDKRRAAR